LGLIPALMGEADGPQNITAVVEHTVVPFEADGLGSTLYHAAPGQQITGPAPSEGRGQYWMVMSGECHLNEHLGGKQALLFVDPTEAAPTITAGSTGASVLLMQFPKRAH
jgi:redox-sensitive bicupin YhaK (pirin superfamily)